MDLRDYDNAKFELAGIVRSLAEAAKDHAAPTGEHIRDLFVRLAEDRFNLAVVGRFGRGKSSLMNAVIGMERLPTGILPLTSVITTVVYGSSAKVVIHYEGRRLADTVDVDELPGYITQQANPGNVRRVRTAEVQLPAEILRRGFYFIDTPGLGSAIVENTRTTESFLPEADALLVVTSYDSPLSQEEAAILRLAARNGRRVFVVLNKQDTVTVAQREEGLDYVGEQLRRAPGLQAPPPFSVSARDGLAAKAARDVDALRASGLAALEDALVRFLVEEKRQAFLANFCERVLDLARSDPAWAPVTARVRAFRMRLEGGDGARAALPFRPAAPAAVVGPLHELADCEICARIQSVSFDFLCRYQYELGVSAEAQDLHARAGGLCAMHTHQLAALAAPRGVAIGYPALLERLSARLAQAARAAGSGARDVLARRDVVADRHACVLCRLCAATLAEATGRVAERLRGDPANETAALSGICMLHLPDLIDALVAAPDGATLAQRILSRESAILARLAEDLRRYATKHDALRRQLATPEETGAAARSLQIVAGLANVPVPEQTASRKAEDEAARPAGVPGR